MSFLNPIFLFALPLAAVPIVLHFVDRRRREVIPWGAMAFLSAASVKGNRFQRLNEWLLLAMRVALLLALVLALARPMLRGGTFGKSASRDLVLILDDSLSTNLRVGTETVYDELRSQATELLSELNGNDRVRVMRTTGDPAWINIEPVSPGTDSFAILQRQVADSGPTLGSTDVFQSVQSALDSFSNEEAADRSRQIVLLCDGQAYGWQTDATYAWRKVRERLDTVGSESSTIDLRVLLPKSFGRTTDGDKIANLAISNVSSRSTLVPVGEEVTFRSTISNLGQNPQSGVPFSWFINDQLQASAVVNSLTVGESRQVEWSTRLDEPGCMRVSCRLTNLADDQLELDDVDQFVVEASQRIPILFVRPKSSYATDSLAHVFFSSALGFRDDHAEGDWQSVYSPQTTLVADLDRVEFDNFHAVVLSGEVHLAPSAMTRLVNFVQSGGGLWIALGADVDVALFNSQWYDEGTGMSPCRVERTIEQDLGDRDPSQEAPRIHRPDENHPATATLSETTRVDLDEVDVKKHYQFDNRDGLRAVSVLLETGSGEPLVVENAFGAGRVIVQSFPLGVEWSNFPLTRAYVVMVQDWLAYLTEPAATHYNLASRTPLRLPRGDKIPVSAARIDSPNGSSVELSDVELSLGDAFRFRRTRLPGSYLVELTTTASASNPSAYYYQVAKNPLESELTPLTQQEMNTLQETVGPLFDHLTVSSSSSSSLSLSAGAGADSSAAVGATAAPAWMWLLVALMGLVVIEMLFASQLAKQRFGY